MKCKKEEKKKGNSHSYCQVLCHMQTHQVFAIQVIATQHMKNHVMSCPSYSQRPHGHLQAKSGPTHLFVLYCVARLTLKQVRLPRLQQSFLNYLEVEERS